MLELLRHEPWLIVVVLGLLIPIFGIVFGTTTNYLARVRQAELEANLKQNMLERGMSAEEIRMVIEATSRRDGKTCGRGSAKRQGMQQEMS
jgi:heme/copper-type cytochrome/quinol oxidase subunit 2